MDPIAALSVSCRRLGKASQSRVRNETDARNPFARPDAQKYVSLRTVKVSSAAKADILAYILNVNHFPPGKTELPYKAELMKEIAIEACESSRWFLAAAPS